MKASIEDSDEEIDEPKPFKSVIERYYTQYYIESPVYQYAFLHTNKLVLLGISKHHPICVKSMANKDYIKSVTLLHEVNVSGKHKS